MAYKTVNGKLVKVGSKSYTVGFFYKATEDDGVNLVLTSEDEVKKGFTERFARQVTDCSKQTLAEIKAGRLTVQDCWDQLLGNDEYTGAIEMYNLAAFGTVKQPPQGYYKVDFVKDGKVNEDLFNAMIMIADNILTLTTLGEIKNDDDNGLLSIVV